MQKMLDQEMELFQKTKEEYNRNPSEKLKRELDGATTRVKVLEKQLHNLTGVSMASKDNSAAGFESSMQEAFEGFEVPPSSMSSTEPPPPLPSQPPPPVSTQSPLTPVSVEHFPSPTSPLEGETMDNSLPLEGDTMDSINFDILESSREQHQDVDDDENDDVYITGVPTSAPESTVPISESDGDVWVKKDLRHRSAPWLQDGPQHARQHSSPETFFHEASDLPGSGTQIKRNLSDATDKEYKRAAISGCDSDPNIHSGSDPHLQDMRESLSCDKIGKDSDSDLDVSLEGISPIKPHSYEEMEHQELIEHPYELPHQIDADSMEEHVTSPVQDIRSPDSTSSSGPELLTATVNTVEPFTSATVSVVQQIPSQQHGIMSMEDDDFQSDNEQPVEDHGPFKSLVSLEKKPAHMAVFLHYLISNSDPSSLVFYIVTDSYSSGNLKEMRKWAYEIYSTFLAEKSPLRINVDDSVLISIDDTMANKIDSIDLMRKIFVPARTVAAEEVKYYLSDYCSKRSLGLASIYGDQQLSDVMERSKEIQIVEQTLMPHLERYTTPDADRERDDKNLAMASALTTFMKQSGVKVQNSNSPLERLPSFTARDKPKLKFRNKKAHYVKGHHFVAIHYQSIAFCIVCGNLLWGIGNQGYQCQNCEQNVHKGNCLENVRDQCAGKESKKKKDKGGKIRNMIPRRTSENSAKAIKEAARQKEEKDRERLLSVGSIDQQNAPTSQPYTTPSSHSHHFPLIQSFDEKEDDDIAQLRGSNKVGRIVEDIEEGNADCHDLQSPGTPRSESPVLTDRFDGDRHDKNKVQRSGSLRTHEDMRRRIPSGQEKRSKSDVDVDSSTVSALTNATSRGSSSSSISTKSQDSSLVSMEYDSDMEAEQDPPAWQTSIDKDILKKLKPREVKRQEVINELFHTEKSHVRNLKILDRVFMRPMKQEQLTSMEMIHLLFPNLDDLLEMHCSLNNAMKKERKTSHTIDEVGDILLTHFDGEDGERLKEACAVFCRHQSYALDALKVRQKKEDKLAKFLADAENNPICRRLQLKDFIPCVFQRLTKYPLLLENILKYTHNKAADHHKVARARDCCKSILSYVNTAVREAENQIRLQELVKKTDKGPFEKSNSPLITEFKNIDLNGRKLLHDGSLIWRLGRAKSIDLHVLLLEDILVLLQKDDSRFVLKCHSSTVQTVKEEVKNTHSPIVKLTNLLCRNVATDKKAFFLVSTSPIGPQIYELVAVTSSERKMWSDIITRTVDGMKNKDKRGTKVTAVPSPLPPPPPDLNEADEEKLKVKSSDMEKINEKNKSDSMDNLDNVVLQINNPPELINPSDVVVVNHKVETMLTRREKLKQADETIHRTLMEKNRIIAEMLGESVTHVKTDEFTTEENQEHEFEAKDLLRMTMLQSSRLTSTLNDYMNTMSSTEQTDSDVAVNRYSGDWQQYSPTISLTEKLLTISKSINDNLTRLMGVVTEDEDVKDIREDIQELSVSDSEQSPHLHSPNTPPTGSRPSSFISIGSSAADDVCDVDDLPHPMSSGDESAASPCSIPAPDVVDCSINEDTNIDRISQIGSS